MFYNEEPMPLFGQIQIDLHVFFCSACAAEIEQYESARTVMRNDFFPPSPRLEDSIMAKLKIENEATEEESQCISGVPSLRGWVISGLILIISLVTAFFGFDFKSLASESGMSFMLPMGITIGIILTIYCALFIGSHLKEFSERFGL
jgi:hypothetical protein